MKDYVIRWKDVKYGESIVSANSVKEAREFAEKGLDHDFEEFDICGDWIIDNVEKI